MAGASMNDIKARIKSVESTRQITKAMELVATSKLRRAKEKVERTRPFCDLLHSAILDVSAAADFDSSVWIENRDTGPTLYIVIAGDRGLAGGYNANVFKLTEAHYASSGKDALWMPVGKKAVEYYRHRNREFTGDTVDLAANVGVGASMKIAEDVCSMFKEGKVGRVVLVYTKFVSMMTQTPVCEQLLPLNIEQKTESHTEFDSPVEEMLESIVPSYVGGLIYSAVTESVASESGARRTAMNAANKNADEMIDSLLLKFNRARQAVITQEITEIVSGAEAL